MSKFYVVKLTLLLGKFEKNTASLVKADNEEQAELLALENESHCSDSGFEEDSGEWWDGDFIYRAYSVIEVEEDTFNELRLYI